MKITVKTYAGYKGDERPVSFSREGRTFQIMEIVDRWYDPDHNCFKVLADDGKTYLLRNDMNADSWELVAPRD
jgi:hypothetical protein